MTAIAQHIRLRLSDDRVIAPTTEKRRLLARVVLTKAQTYRPLVFSCPDTHLHLAAACNRVDAGKLARRLGLSLRRNLQIDVSFARSYVGAIRDARHLYNTFKYILGQRRRHELQADPFQEGTNLPDLLGLRPIGSYTISNVRDALPRIRMPDLLEPLGVASLEPVVAPPSPATLLEAGLMAGALSSLDKRCPSSVEVKRAIVSVGWSHVPPRRLAELLKVNRRTIYRLRRGPTDPAFERAVRLQMDLISQQKAAVTREAPFLCAPASKSIGPRSVPRSERKETAGPSAVERKESSPFRRRPPRNATNS